MARVLVVDDEPNVRELIATLLGLEGFDVDVAADGVEALDRCAIGVPDLIVLDLAMPNMDGWHLLDELHQRGLRRKTRVVICSGYLDESRDVDASHRIAKPFAPEALVRVIDDALAHEPDDLYDRGSEELGAMLRVIDETLA